MAAQAGTLFALGASGRTYQIDLYLPDATATSLTFNPAGLAGTGSPTNWRTPEDVVIYDVSIGTAPTAVGVVLNVNGAILNGASLRWANQLAANPNRGKLNLKISKGDMLGGIQY